MRRNEKLYPKDISKTDSQICVANMFLLIELLIKNAYHDDKMGERGQSKKKNKGSMEEGGEIDANL